MLDPTSKDDEGKKLKKLATTELNRIHKWNIHTETKFWAAARWKISVSKWGWGLVYIDFSNKDGLLPSSPQWLRAIYSKAAYSLLGPVT